MAVSMLTSTDIFATEYIDVHFLTIFEHLELKLLHIAHFSTFPKVSNYPFRLKENTATFQP